MRVANISYGYSGEAWGGYAQSIMALIDKYDIKTVCDVGGGANPLIAADYIASNGLDYFILDISETELSKAPKNYGKIVADIASPDFSIDQKFDLVFSKMLAEHIVDAKQFHTNVLNMLTDDGLAVHFFPTLFALPFVMNYLIPDFLSDILLKIFAPRDRHQHAKFPAYYHWCRGPTRGQLERFSKLGYEIVEYRGLFGHKGYYRKVKMLQKIHQLKTDFLVRNPIPLLTSYAYVVLSPRRMR